MEIRAVTFEDAPAACQVMRRSIAELCVADHRNDEAILTRWLANKTPEIFASWIRRPENSLFVAVEGGNILAVGSTTFRRMRGFAASVVHCSGLSKRGPRNEATHDVP
jgi:hypothetical protein